eukprot:UN04121
MTATSPTKFHIQQQPQVVHLRRPQPKYHHQHPLPQQIPQQHMPQQYIAVQQQQPMYYRMVNTQNGIQQPCLAQNVMYSANAHAYYQQRIPHRY